jgi:hypothetical protein
MREQGEPMPKSTVQRKKGRRPASAADSFISKYDHVGLGERIAAAASICGFALLGSGAFTYAFARNVLSGQMNGQPLTTFGRLGFSFSALFSLAICFFFILLAVRFVRGPTTLLDRTLKVLKWIVAAILALAVIWFVAVLLFHRR